MNSKRCPMELYQTTILLTPKGNKRAETADRTGENPCQLFIHHSFNNQNTFLKPQKMK